MTSKPTTGHDGPYSAPVAVPARAVDPDWIDYNGHMNVGYYSIAFDEALDVLLEDQLGIGLSFVEASGQGPYVLQAHLHYLRELLEGDRFQIRFRLMDHDAKRLHVYGEMWRDADLCACQEILAMNVDHKTGRGAPYPDWAQVRLRRMQVDHAALPHSTQVGAPIGIRRR